MGNRHSRPLNQGNSLAMLHNRGRNDQQNRQPFWSELTGFPAQTERCCGDLERLRPASGVCPAGYLSGRG